MIIVFQNYIIYDLSKITVFSRTFFLLDTFGDHIILLQSSTTPRINEIKHFFGEIDFYFSGTSAALDTSHSPLPRLLSINMDYCVIPASNGRELRARVHINILFIVTISSSHVNVDLHYLYCRKINEIVILLFCRYKSIRVRQTPHFGIMCPLFSATFYLA